MKFLQLFIIIFFVAALSIESDAQRLKENEIVVIKGEKYVLRQVRTGETVYSISNQFNIDSLTLLKHNPKVSDGLKVGDILKIPYNEGADLQEEPIYKKGDPAYFDFHTISSRKETPYFISREYGITVEELYAYNPEVSRFRKGIKLRIPRWNDQSKDSEEAIVISENGSSDNEKNELIKHEVSSGETLYSISRQYNLSESEILFYNPGADDLKSGSVIYLPRTDKTIAASEEESGEVPEADLSAETEAETENIEAEREDRNFTGGNYFEHTIVSGETLWGVSHKYDVPEQKLKELNPVLESGFPAGVKIKIPVEEESLTRTEPVNKDAFINHRVKKGETLYGLATEYNMTIPEIRKYNPVLENRNLVLGETIIIPRKPDKEIMTFMEERRADSIQPSGNEFDNEYYEIKVVENIPERCRPASGSYFSNTTYDITLFLPLFTLANDTMNRETILSDSLFPHETFTGNNPLESTLPEEDFLIEQEERKEIFHGFYRNSENFLQFYEGVLIAVDSMQRTGMNIRLNVFDTRQDPNAIKEHIYSGSFLETDLIIGPVYPQVQDEVSAIAAKNRIPMVSPLSSQSSDLESNSYLYQINPSREYLAVKTAELIAEEYFNSNFIVLQTGGGDPMAKKVVELAREKLFQSGYWGEQSGVNFSVYDFDAEGPFGLRRILSRSKENVIFIPSVNEGELSVSLSNMNNLSEEYSITLIGLNRYDQFRSVDREYFHNLKLQYIDPYWVDYESPLTIRYIEMFKRHFHTEPNNFGFQGYDVAFYFLNALKDFGRDFEDCLPYMRTNLVQGNYQFEKVSSFGGYMNRGVSVISYQPDYDVVRKRVIGRYRFAQK